MVVSSNAGTTFADIGATGVRWWLQMYLPQDRKHAVPLLERAVAGGAEAVVLTVDTPVVGTKYAAGDRIIWDVVDPGFLRVNFEPGYADAEGADKATDLGRVRPGLAGRDHRPARGGQGRAAPRRRPTVRGRGRRRRVGVQPRRPPARPGRHHCVVPPRRRRRGRRRGAGVRRRRDPLRPRRAGGALPRRRRRLPGPIAAARARRGGSLASARMLEELRVEVVEALRLAGCRDLADTRGLAVLDPPNGL